MLTVGKDGWIDNVKVVKEHRPKIEHEKIGSINAIVLHRTGSVNATSVLNAWKTKKEGTHFLISETGKIYQTASVNKQCWHVGKLYSRCRTTSSCDKADAKAIEKILHQKNASWGTKFRMVTRHETKKNYPDRFPHNHDSLGIEIVGLISLEKEIYEIPNVMQLKSLYWLIDELVSTYGVTIEDLYAHGKIAHKDKKKSEGASALKAYVLQKKK